MPPKKSVLPSTGCKVMVCVFIQSEFSWTIMTLFVRVCSNDAEFLWRLARASRDLSLLPNIEAGRKKQLTFEAFEYAKKALEKDDLCSAAHKVRLWFLRGQLDTHRMLITSFNRFLFRPLVTQWYGVCLSDVGDYEGVKVKIGNSYIIRDHLEVRGP